VFHNFLTVYFLFPWFNFLQWNVVFAPLHEIKFFE
jgi:hypothetical protein